MGRSPNSSSSDESGVKKGPWTPEEDDKLIKYIQQHGHGSWRALPKLAGLNRCGKSCRLRWTNYLRPDIKRGKFSQDEEQTILNLHAILGNKWSAIATHLPGRTDNEIKNFWNTHLKKKLIQMGFDPMTHRPRTDLFSALPQLVALANLIDYAPPLWDSDSLQFARLNHFLQSLLTPPPPSAAVAPFPNINNINANFSNLETASPDLQALAAAVGLGLDQPISAAAGFSHLPGLQTVDNNDGGYCAPTCDLGSVSGGGESSMWTQKNLMMQSPAEAPVAETPVSTASYGGDQIWAELSDIFPDIA